MRHHDDRLQLAAAALVAALLCVLVALAVVAGCAHHRLPGPGEPGQEKVTWHFATPGRYVLDAGPVLVGLEIRQIGHGEGASLVWRAWWWPKQSRPTPAPGGTA